MTSQVLAQESKPAALELHRLLKDIDPSRWRADVAQAARARARRLSDRFSELWRRAPSDDRLASQAADIAKLLEQLPHSERKDDWFGYQKELGAAYEQLSQALRAQAVELPSLRPTNYKRSLFHVSLSVMVLLLIEEVLAPSALWIPPLIVAGIFWSLEMARQHSAKARALLVRIFQPIAHPHEKHRINSSTWFATALTILALAFDPLICAVAVVVLGLADPAAALVGRRWGRTKLVNQRSLEGTLTFALVGFVAAFGVLAIWHADVALGRRIAIAAGGALAGALGELYSRRVDDNFSIPLAAALGGAVGAFLIG